MADQQGASQAPDSALARLAVFVGEWAVEGTIGGKGNTTGMGSTTFEWVEHGAFLRQRTGVEESAYPRSTLIIGCDDVRDAYTVLYSDSRGVRRIYQMRFDGRTWRQWRDAPGFSQRFSATLSADGRVFTGAWEKSEDGTTWEHDFDLTYTKIG